MNKKGAAGDFTKSPIFWVVTLIIILGTLFWAVTFFSTLLSDSISEQKLKR